MTFSLRLGTRGSPLALTQARMVSAALRAAHGWNDSAIEIVPIRTTGDRVQDRPLAELGGKALWTKELDRALIDGEIDFAVHSMKDVETIRPPEILIAAMLPRADVRDRLIGAGSLDDLPEGAVVGTSSPRRAAQVRRLRPDLRTVSIRGNVDTRLARRASGEVDATLLAAAGLDRLGRGEVGSAIPLDLILPAPAQGAVGIECRADDARAIALLGAIDHGDTSAAVAAERAFTLALGGTCHSPIAALALVDGAMIDFRCEVLSADGAEHVADTARFAVGDLEAPAALARQMLARAPAAIRRLFEPE